MSLNNCEFHGRLGANPEITTFQDGKERVRFSLAVDRDYKDQDGNRPTDWISVTMWGSANYVRKTNLKKGDCVIVTGRMEQYQWTDEQGQKRNVMGLNCNHIYLTAKKRSEEDEDDDDDKSAKDKAFEHVMNKRKQEQAQAQQEADDDLPF